MKKIDELTTRIKALMGSTPPSYEEFVRQWADTDGLSKSLFEVGAACPELVGGNDPYMQTIRGHLARMGVQPEPFTLESVLEDMGDD